MADNSPKPDICFSWRSSDRRVIILDVPRNAVARNPGDFLRQMEAALPEHAYIGVWNFEDPLLPYGDFTNFLIELLRRRPPNLRAVIYVNAPTSIRGIVQNARQLVRSPQAEPVPVFFLDNWTEANEKIASLLAEFDS